MFTKLLLFFNTVKYLKLIQIRYQIYRRVFSQKPKKVVSSIRKRHPINGYCCFIKKKQSIFDSETFIFFGTSGKLSEISWVGQQRNELWRYNQHYFDDLNSDITGRRTKIQLKIIDRWIIDNPPNTKPGWDAYPTSLRIVNWIKFDLQFRVLSEDQLRNLYTQALWLEKNLEWHLLGNHLFSNMKALIFAGLFFEGPDADRWVDLGLKILSKELNEQILEDGGHFELSPMYHSIILEDLLDIINILTVYSLSKNSKYILIFGNAKAKAAEMLFWLKTMCHPDGRISFFNDTALNVAPIYGELESYARDLCIDPPLIQRDHAVVFKSTGFFVWKKDDNCLIFDVGDVGASYLPGHAHADTLSIECSINGKNLIVNSGTSDYQRGFLRTFQRSTKAHSTVTINGFDSSEMWASFRVARRAKVIKTLVQNEFDKSIFKAKHNGYSRLKGRFFHEREIHCEPKGITIIDSIFGNADAEIVVNYFLAPGILATKLSPFSYRLVDEYGFIDAEIEFSEITTDLSPAYWYPEFGSSEKNFKLSVRYDGKVPKLIKTKLKWS